MPSSVIQRFHYSPTEEALDITFVSGRRYRYRAVPPQIYDDMRTAFAKGDYFNRHIRDHFAFEPLDEH